MIQKKGIYGDQELSFNREREMHILKTTQFPTVDKINYSIIDFHRHLSDHCGEEAQNYNIKEICLMPSWTTVEQFREKVKPINDFTQPELFLSRLENFYQNSHGWHGKIYPFIPIDFNKSSDNLVTLIEKYHPTGIKIHPLQNFPIEQEFLSPYMKIIEAQNLITYIHTDWTPSTEFNKNRPTIFSTFGKIAKTFPNITFIMGHAGNADSFAFAANIIKKHPNCYAESSISPSTWQLERIIRQADPTRLLFGSNSPFCNAAVEIYKIQTLFKVTEEQKQAIFYINAKNLLENRPYVEV